MTHRYPCYYVNGAWSFALSFKLLPMRAKSYKNLAWIESDCMLKVDFRLLMKSALLEIHHNYDYLL